MGTQRHQGLKPKAVTAAAGAMIATMYEIKEGLRLQAKGEFRSGVGEPWPEGQLPIFVNKAFLFFENCGKIYIT